MTTESEFRSLPDPWAACGSEFWPVSGHFSHPRDVLASDLDRNEKRRILAEWASDRFAVESQPALRLYPGTSAPVPYDDIVAALKALDAGGSPSLSRRHSIRQSPPDQASRRWPQPMRAGRRSGFARPVFAGLRHNAC